MQVVILAAGMGTRLGERTRDLPKAMIPVLGRELVLRTFDFLDQTVVTKVTVVTGYQDKIFSKFLRTHVPQVQIVHNPDYREGSIKSLEVASRFFATDDVLVMNSDHIYPKRMFKKIRQCDDGIYAVCDRDRILGLDDMKVRLNGQGRLEKIRKTLTQYDLGYIGMSFISSKYVGIYQEAIGATMVREGKMASADFVLGILASFGAKVSVCDASGIGWLEVDTKEDMMAAEAKLTDKEFLL